MDFFLIIVIAILPSTIWLLFFLRKDVHPEPKSMILKVLLFGALVAPIAAFGGTGVQEILLDFNLSPDSLLFFIIYWFFGVAMIEELLKYFVVRFSVLSHHEFDEPTDAMLYMIISGMGFAALENILVLVSQTILNQSLGATLSLIIYRFLTAVFLHALCSGLIGYFLALSICDAKHQFKLISTGISLGIIFHALYDIAAIKISHNLVEVSGKVKILNFEVFAISATLFFTILIGLSFFVIYGFKKLKKMQSICKIE